DLDRAREIVGEGVLELLAPTRTIGRQAAARSKVDGRHIEASIETTAAIEADLLRVEFIEIVKDAADGEAFVVVELLVENAERDAAGVQHQVFANQTAGVGEAIGKLLGGRKQEQPGSFGSVG